MKLVFHYDPYGYFKTHATPRALSPADYLGLIINEIWLSEASEA